MERSKRSAGSSSTQQPTQLYNQLLLAALLQHSSISHDKSVLLPPLQATKQLQAAAAAQCAGQLALSVQFQQLQQARSFVFWLHRHAPLLQQLHLDFLASHTPAWLSSARWLNADAAVAAALLWKQQQLRLQSFSMRGAHCDWALLTLPPSSLTHRSIDVQKITQHNYLALTALRSLDLCDSSQPSAIHHHHHHVTQSSHSISYCQPSANSCCIETCSFSNIDNRKAHFSGLR
jgi:hypothetical protein